MRQIKVALVILGMAMLPVRARSAAFEEHTSWQKEPVLETEKGISLGKSVLEMGTGFRYLYSDAFFNSGEKIQNLEDNESWMKYEVMVLDLFARFGFTSNWTLWFNLPFVWSNNKDRAQPRETNGQVGDCQAGVVYQFLRQDDPTLSMGVALSWKLPTGQESGAKNLNITGTGITDVELAYLGRWQILQNLAIGWATGYNIRFPGTVQYLSDRHTYITNPFLNLGDELFIRGEVTAAIEMLAFRLLAELRYRLVTEVAMAEFRQELVQWTNPQTGQTESDTFVLYNGARYQEWDVHEQLDPTKGLVSSSGYLATVTPQLVFRPWYWLDLTLFAKFHLLGKNSIYLTDKDGNNSTFNNFMPMQSLGISLGSVVLGEVGGLTTIRW